MSNFDEIKELMAKHSDALAGFADAVKARDEEVKELGEAGEETKAAVEQSQAELKALTERYEELSGNFEKTEELLKNFIAEQEQASFTVGEEYKTLGQKFVEAENYINMVESGGKSCSVQLKSSDFPLSFKSGEGAVNQTTAGAVVNPTRVPGIFMAPQRPFRLRDVMTVNTTDESSVEFVVETGFYQLYTKLVNDASIGATTLDVENARGFYPGQTIYLSKDAAAEEAAVVSSVDTDASPNTITLTAATGNAHLTANEAAAMADDFVYTPECELKPCASAKLALEQCPMKTLAHKIYASRQILMNRPMLVQYINERMIEGLRFSEENQILYGSGAADQLQGIFTHPDVSTYAQSTVAGDTKIDAVRRALTLSQLLHYSVDAILMNPVDWEAIQLTKDLDDNYIWTNAQGAGLGDGNNIWGVPVIITTAINAGDFLLGPFRLAAALWDRDRANLRVAEENKDQFERNMVTILAELEECLTIYRPEAFVAGSFDV